MLDRIDIHVEVAALPYEQLIKAPTGENLQAIRERVNRARDIQLRRFEGRPGLYSNAHLQSKDLRRFCTIPERR